MRLLDIGISNVTSGGALCSRDLKQFCSRPRAKIESINPLPPQKNINQTQTYHTMSRRNNLLPIASRFLRNEDPSTMITYKKSGPKKHPRSEAEWAHHFRANSPRLVLCLDLSPQATAFRNQLKDRFFHPWGSFEDTRITLIDPLPDRNFYLKGYKEAINSFCDRGPPPITIGPTSNIWISENDRRSGLVNALKPMNSSGTKMYYPNDPKRDHLLILLSFGKDSVLHKIRSYFLDKFSEFPSEEIQTTVKNLKEERYKAKIPLGFCKDLGTNYAEKTRENLIYKYKKTNGICLGDAVGLSLWRDLYEPHPTDKWRAPILTGRECVYSRGLAKSEEFVSIAPAEQIGEDMVEEATKSEVGTKFQWPEDEEEWAETLSEKKDVIEKL